MSQEALPAIISSLRRHRAERAPPPPGGDESLQEASAVPDSVPAPRSPPPGAASLPADTSDAPVRDDAPGTEGTGAAEGELTYSEAEIARIADVSPWYNHHGRMFASYQFNSHLAYAEDLDITFPTGYEIYQGA